MNDRVSIYDLFLALTRLASGRSCRRCADEIRPSDPFGLSESVCAGCRL